MLAPQPRRVGEVDPVGVVAGEVDGLGDLGIALGDRLRRPVLVDGALLELLEVAAVGVRARRLALPLIGGGELAMIAGPCAVENEEMLNKIARHVRDGGATIEQLLATNKPRSTDEFGRVSAA